MKHIIALLLLGLSFASQAQLVPPNNDALRRWVSALTGRIHENWVPPTNGIFAKVAPCRVQISILPNGEIVSVQVLRHCSDVPYLKNALERAVLKSQPLPLPDDPSVFTSTLILHFRPENER